MTDFPSYDKTDVERGVSAVFEEHGYLTTNTEVVQRDLDAVASALFVPVSAAIANKVSDRAGVMVSRGALRVTGFPGAPDPNDADDTPNPALTRAIVAKLDDITWGLSQTTDTGKLQRKAASLGLVLVRTKLAPKGQKDAVDGVYLTADKACWWLDTYGRVMKRHASAVAGSARELAIFMERVPAFAEDVNDAFKRDTQKALEAGEQLLLPALEAATMVDEDADDDVEDAA